MTLYNLVSFGGIFVLLGFAILISPDRKNINRRLIVCGLGLQLLFAAFVFLVPAGTRLFLLINDGIIAVLESASAGSRFVFGRLAVPPGGTSADGEP